MHISVVICTFNRSSSLSTTLSSLQRLVSPVGLEWEVIVVDNNSTDDTDNVVRDAAGKASYPVTYIKETRQGLSHARNTGVRAARGDIVSFLDDDVIVDASWLANINQAFSQSAAACIGGKVLISNSLIKPPWWRSEYDVPLGEFNPGDVPLRADSDVFRLIGIGANLSFRRSAFERYGEFRADLGRTGNSLVTGEETEFVQRLCKGGDHAIYRPECLVYHCPSASRMRVGYLSRWYYRLGEWEFRGDPGPASHLWFGVPRWLYRKLARCIGECIVESSKVLVSSLSLRTNALRYHVIRLSCHLGKCKGVSERILQRNDVRAA